MRRTPAIVIACITLVVLVVAMLPAQEAVPWKRPGKAAAKIPTSPPAGSVYGDEDAPEPAQFPMGAAENLHAAPSSEPVTDSNVRQAQLRRRAGFQDRHRDSEVSPAAEPEPSADDDSRHSVLKRGTQEVDDPADSPALASPADDRGIVSPSPGVSSSRRTTRPTVSGRSPSAPPAVASRVSELHVTSRMPALRVELVGPGSIQTGKAAKFTIYANNEGDASAQDIVVQLPLPGSVNLTKGESTAGDAEVKPQADGSLALVWAIPSLPPRGHETLQMHLVPSDGEAFELEMSWTCRPAAASARVVVKQPQLALSLSGPADMLLGEEKTFTLLVSNPGTGDATGVEVNVATGSGQPQKVQVGVVPAGQQAEIPVQVAGNEPGELEIRATAQAEGELSADAAGKVQVRSANLAVAVEGPQLQFAGAEATYVVVVANRGNAAADATTISVQLPAEARYIGGVDGAAAGKSVVKWNAGVIPPGAEKSFEMRCQLLAEGANHFLAKADARHSIGGAAEAITEVQAVAELKLAVNDPTGPASVGSEVVYEVQIMNRGTRAAPAVKVLMQFGPGIEPTGVMGGKGKIVPGQVVFDPIPSLEAGEQVTVKVKAKGEKSGTHQYRVEVTAGDDGTRLVSEGTSRFFAERGAQAPATPAAARTANKPQMPTPAKGKQR
ncbi:MAG TPA: CARDB domain-containing protein [Pirellulaceae bacterium]|nr:CARDB domain-containing protein [Pirellulaceae bacterium]